LQQINYMKNILWFLLSVLVFSCSEPEKKVETIKIYLEGKAQGTTYHITYFDKENRNFQSQIDSILDVIDASMSTWDSTSIISKINKADTAVIVDFHFKNVFYKAHEISKMTDGLFDATVAPLVNAYGFGFKKIESVTGAKIDSLKQLVDYTKVELKNNKIYFASKGMQIDFNAIAQGYSVDVLVDFLKEKGITDLMVELGGEVKCLGIKDDGSNWKIGIDKPEENQTERPLQAILSLENEALATSGNYRKFYEFEGKKFAHILNPLTGKPVIHNLLSASVVAEDCMSADAYATAFMIMGHEKAISFINQHPELNLHVYLIFVNDNGKWETFTSNSLKEKLSEMNEQ